MFVINCLCLFLVFFKEKKHYTFSSKRSVNGWYAGYINKRGYKESFTLGKYVINSIKMKKEIRIIHNRIK